MAGGSWKKSLWPCVPPTEAPWLLLTHEPGRFAMPHIGAAAPSAHSRGAFSLAVGRLI